MAKYGHRTDRSASSAPVGSGDRFRALVGQLSNRKGVSSPKGLAGAIGRKKYGKSKMAAMSAAGRRKG